MALNASFLDKLPEEDKIIFSYIITNKIPVTFKEKTTGPHFNTYSFAPEIGFKLPCLKGMAENLNFLIGTEGISVSTEDQLIKLIVPIKNSPVIDYKSYLYDLSKEIALRENNDVPYLPLGIDTAGRKEFIPILSCPHVLISGSTGTGKSNYLSVLLTTWLMLYDKDKISVDVVDIKGVDLVFFKDFPIINNYIRTIPDFSKLLDSLELLVKKRLHQFSGKYRNIKEYNKSTNNKMPYKIILVDEFGSISAEYKNKKAELQDAGIADPMGKLLFLSQLSRAAGVHFILSTQRASVKIITGDIKANFPTRISFRLPSEIDSRIALDSGGAEELLSCGDMLIKRPDKASLQRCHVPYISVEDMSQLVNYKLSYGASELMV